MKSLCVCVRVLIIFVAMLYFQSYQKYVNLELCPHSECYYIYIYIYVNGGKYLIYNIKSKIRDDLFVLVTSIRKHKKKKIKNEKNFPVY